MFCFALLVFFIILYLLFVWFLLHQYFGGSEEVTTKSAACEIPEDPRFPLCLMKVKVSLNNFIFGTVI